LFVSPTVFTPMYFLYRPVMNLAPKISHMSNYARGI
jgi:hypothetical protein